MKAEGERCLRYLPIWRSDREIHGGLGPQAETELASIWLDSKNRNRVKSSADELERQLQTKPDGAGESREKGLRVAFLAPLGIKFLVRHDDRIVQVLDVWQYDG